MKIKINIIGDESVTATPEPDTTDGDAPVTISFSGDENAIDYVVRHLASNKFGHYGHTFSLEPATTLLDLSSALHQLQREGTIQSFEFPNITYKPVPEGARS